MNNDVLSRNEIKARMIKIARGEIKVQEKDPKVFYENERVKRNILKK